MAAMTTTLRKPKSAAAVMLCNAVIISIISSFVLSAEAIRCHQCNSHLEEDCIKLRLGTPRAQLDEHFLKDCPADSFCRKQVISIEATGEHRIMRECGSLKDYSNKVDHCYSADNEGVLRTICICDKDGCNAAPSLLSNGNLYIVLSLLGALLVLVRQF